MLIRWAVDHSSPGVGVVPFSRRAGYLVWGWQQLLLSQLSVSHPPVMGLCQETKLLCINGQHLGPGRQAKVSWHNTLVRTHQQVMNFKISITWGRKTAWHLLVWDGVRSLPGLHLWNRGAAQSLCNRSHMPQHSAGLPAWLNSLSIRGSYKEMRFPVLSCKDTGSKWGKSAKEIQHGKNFLYAATIPTLEFCLKR